MFAFEIFDEPQHKLFLARDRAGEKPLFYRLANGSLQFASELKGLLANPANPRKIGVRSRLIVWLVWFGLVCFVGATPSSR